MKSKLDRFNRHLDTPFDSVDAFSAALQASYQRTNSATLTGKEFGGVTCGTVRNWLRLFGLPVGGKGGPNFKGHGLADAVNALDQEKLKTLDAYAIGKIVGCSGRYIHTLKSLGKITAQYKHRKRGRRFDIES